MGSTPVFKTLTGTLLSMGSHMGSSNLQYRIPESVLYSKQISAGGVPFTSPDISISLFGGKWVFLSTITVARVKVVGSQLGAGVSKGKVQFCSSSDRHPFLRFNTALLLCRKSRPRIAPVVRDSASCLAGFLFGMSIIKVVLPNTLRGVPSTPNNRYSDQGDSKHPGSLISSQMSFLRMVRAEPVSTKNLKWPPPLTRRDKGETE